MWSLNGDHVSRIYAGTGALGGGRSKVSLCIDKPTIFYFTSNLVCPSLPVLENRFPKISVRNKFSNQ